ncbi:MAG: hypothetical protein BJ554DRAFT_6101 [Olpidium bornovanus]|uniref:Uncharacterized protein n=1 Tax=Olpidium bornovanus TaxID=278681 RepID=A0A8H7ZYG5_9FUNG|nr:MAG: hypothetical protein BJ554DRAFT_6101 [Olpidium bornovanus]
MTSGRTGLLSGAVSTHVEVQDWYIDVVQQLRVVLDRIAAREENDDLLLEVLFQEREEEEEPLFRIAHHVALLQSLRCGDLFVLVNVNRNPGEVFDLGGLRGGEEHRLAIWKHQA